jgi:membrane-associated phospholipid phosphatase
MESVWAWGNNFIVTIQTVHNPVLDGFFNAITFLGEQEFFLLILPFVIWTINKPLGLRLSYLVLISLAFNTWAKLIVAHPRPFEWPSETDSPVLKLNQQAVGPGIPSGHTQSSLTMWFYLAYHFRQRWLWIAAILLFILVSFSRVYLGVHFPTDLLGGAVLGLIILVIFVKFENSLVTQLAAQSVWRQIGLATIIPFLIMLIHPHPDTLAAISVVSGLSLGVIFDSRKIGFVVTGSVVRRALRFILGMIVLVAIFFGLELITPDPENIFHLPLDVFRHLLVGFWVGGGALWLFKRINLA